MKKILQGGLLAFLMFSMTGSIAAGEIIAHWDFNSAAGRIIADQTGKHPAAISTSSRMDTYVSPDDKAMLFAGGGSSAEVKHADDIALEDDFTIKYIIKPTKLKDFRTLLFKGCRTVKPNIVSYCVDARDGKVELKAMTATGDWRAWGTSEPVLKENEWFLVVMSYKNGLVKLWVNGKERKISQAQSPAPDGKLLKHNYPLIIGVSQDSFGGSSYPFVGLIDDIKIIKGAADSMPQSEIDEWNKRLADLTQRELAEKSQRLTAKIDKFSDKFSVDANEIKNIGARISAVAALPAEKTDEGFAAADRELNNLLFKSYYKKYSSAPDSFVVAFLDTARRIDKRPEFVTMLPPASTQFKLQAAGNEYEGFQALLIGNPDKNVGDIKIRVSDLVDEIGKQVISSKQITFGQIKDIVTVTPDVPVEFTGAIPDMIEEDVPPSAIPKASFVPVYFKVYVPAGTPAGIYKGGITFSGNGISKTVELQVKVFGFSLPKRFALKMAFSFFEKNYQDWYDYQTLTETQKMYIYNFLLNYGISPNNIYAGGGTYPEPLYLEKLKDRINFLTFSANGPDKPVSEAELDKIIDAKAAVYEKIKTMGLEKYAYYYSYDELDCNMKYFPAAKQMLPAMRKKIPGLKAMQTSFPNPQIKDLFNVWSPIFYHFADNGELQILQDLKQRGDEIWWYSADTPTKPYLNYFLDYPVLDCRILGALSFMYKVDGALYWSINREWATNLDIKADWPQKPWKSYIVNIFTKKKVDKNGMGNLMYPGPSGRIYPALRLENLRDGVEDYEYLTTLKNAVDKLQKTEIKNKQALLDKASGLLAIPADVAVAVNNFSADPDNLLKYRVKVAEMIEEINRVLINN